MILLCVFSIILSCSKGSIPITLYQILFGHLNDWQINILNLRLTRTFNALIAGGLLALSGTLIQLLLENPLADPYVLGISSGTGFFMLLGALCGLSQETQFFSAAVGSLSILLLILYLTKKENMSNHRLLLLGMMMTWVFTAGINIILFLSPENKLHDFYFWLAGEINDTQMNLIAAGIFIFGLFITLLLAPGLNLLLRGETESALLGLNTNAYRLIIFILTAVFSSTVVINVGCIGFIGLIAPHISKHVTHARMQTHLIMSMLIGATLLIFADTVARTLFAPSMLPTGMVIAVLGAPLYLWLFLCRT